MAMGIAGLRWREQCLQKHHRDGVGGGDLPVKKEQEFLLGWLIENPEWTSDVQLRISWTLILRAVGTHFIEAIVS